MKWWMGLGMMVVLALEVSGAALPDIVATEQAQARILILDANQSWKHPEAIRWEWTARDNPQILPEHRDWFNTPDEAKYVLDGTHILLTACNGAALVRIADRKVIFYVPVGGNPHSAELLPDGNLVTASSTGNYLRLYYIPDGGVPDPEQVFSVKIPMEDAHGAVWDEARQLLYVSGTYGIVAFAYNFNREHPALTRHAEYPVYQDGTAFHGHDLFPEEDSGKLLLTGIDVRRFDPADGSYEIVSNAPDIKSATRCGDMLLVSQPQEEWWTDTASILVGDELASLQRLPGARFYKFRWAPKAQ